MASKDTGDGLLVPHAKFPSIRARKVTLIRIEGDDIRFSNRIDGKHRLLSRSPDSAFVLRSRSCQEMRRGAF